MARAITRLWILATSIALGLAGCSAGNPFTKKATELSDAGTETSARLVDRDVEAPAVFQVTDTALWDGRPSLGGVWVASPDAVDPERVILRNDANGKFVIGALFRRERINPGPTLQISSDAAAALGMLAGQPGTINVTALRHEEAASDAPDATKPILDAPETVETQTLDASATARAALDKTQAAQPAPTTAPTKAAAPAKGGTLIQIGTFSVEANAKRSADALTEAGVTSRVLKEQAQGKDFWRVVAGPAADKAALMAKVKAQGFADAYVVSR